MILILLLRVCKVYVFDLSLPRILTTLKLDFHAHSPLPSAALLCLAYQLPASHSPPATEPPQGKGAKPADDGQA